MWKGLYSRVYVLLRNISNTNIEDRMKWCSLSEKPASEIKPDCGWYFWKGYAILFFTHGYDMSENNVQIERYKTRQHRKSQRTAASLVMNLSFISERKKKVQSLYYASKKPEVQPSWMVKFPHWKLCCAQHTLPGVSLWAIRAHADLRVNQQTSLIL
jgi:hypothetical protein